MPIINPKHKKKFLIELANKYIVEFGYSYTNLSKKQFWQTLPYIKEFESTNGNMILYLTPLYAKELETEGFVQVDLTQGCFYITDKGFERALELRNPIRNFYKKHWQWFIGIVLTLINVCVGVAYKFIYVCSP